MRRRGVGSKRRRDFRGADARLPAVSTPEEILTEDGNFVLATENNEELVTESS